jgi:hypothetical protein
MLDLHSAYSTSVNGYKVQRSAKRYEQWEVRNKRPAVAPVQFSAIFLEIVNLVSAARL